MPEGLSTRVADQLPRVTQGRLDLGRTPGLGLDIDPMVFRDLVTWSGDPG